MKYIVFITTLIAYMTIHSMRMSVSFVQASIIQFFNIQKSLMGLAMAGVYIILGVSFLIRTFVPLKNLQFTYLLTVSLAAISYSLIPLAASLNIHNVVILFVGLGLFGFFQSSTWPLLLKMLNKYFHPQEDGCMVGLWSSNGDFGNILGFFSCTVIEFYLLLPWEICMYFSSFLGLLLAIIIYLLPIENAQQLNQDFSQQNHTQILCQQYKKVFKNPILLLTIILFCTLKALMYGVLLWLPMYFAQGNFGDFKGYILIVMSIFSIFGSIFMGYIYETLKSPLRKSVVIIIAQSIMVASFYGIKLLELFPQNKWYYLVLIAIIGFCLVGNFNVLITHQPLLIARSEGIGLSSFSSLLMALGNTSVGILEIIIGFAVTESIDSIFTIFFIVSILCLSLYIIRTLLIWSSHSELVDCVPLHQEEVAQNQENMRQI